VKSLSTIQLVNVEMFLGNTCVLRWGECCTLCLNGLRILLVEVILPLMLPTPVAPIECRLAVRTLVRLVAIVLVHVRPKVALCGQLFIANRTGIANAFMYDAPMSFETSLAAEACSAHIAVERLVTRVGGLVLLEVPVLVGGVVALRAAIASVPDGRSRWTRRLRGGTGWRRGG